MSIRIKISAILCLVTELLVVNALSVVNYGRCRTPNRELASCIDLQECSSLYNLLQSSSLSTEDRDYLRNSQCGYYNNKVLICCPESYQYSTTVQPLAPQPILARTSLKNINSTETDLLPKPPQCGFSFKERIFGGNVTSIDEFPWMALIEYTKPHNVKGHYCGGVLISKRYVVTAAHCVSSTALPSNWHLSGVRLGEWDTRTNPDCEEDIRGDQDCAPEHLDVPVVEQISHPQYDRTIHQENDIALLRLAYSVTFSDFVKPICLPFDTNLRRANFVGTTMDIAGWGRTEESDSSPLKLKATVNVVNLVECQHTYSSKDITLSSKQMCAGGKDGKDTCRGDSGGPLMVEQIVNNRRLYFLAGVVSFGPTPCGTDNWPGVYTRVGEYMDWIENTVRT